MDPCHYNFSSSEFCHYNSSILKHAITISPLLSSCHFLHFRRRWAHLQTVVYVFRCRMAQYAPGSSDKIEPGAQSRPPPLWQSAYTRPAGLVRSRCEILTVGGREPPQHWHRRRPPCRRVAGLIHVLCSMGRQRRAKARRRATRGGSRRERLNGGPADAAAPRSRWRGEQ